MTIEPSTTRSRPQDAPHACRGRHLPQTAAALALLLATLTGCASSTSNDSTAATSTTLAADAEQAAVERAYRSAIEAFEATLIDPTAGSGRLDAWWAGPALASAASEVNTWAGFGQHLRFPEPSQRSIEVLSVSIDGNAATLTSCVVDDGQIVDAASGSLLNDDVATVRESVGLSRVEGRWLVIERSRLDRQTGAGTCGA
jgi:hypothetical protein